MAEELDRLLLKKAGFDERLIDTGPPPGAVDRRQDETPLEQAERGIRPVASIMAAIAAIIAVGAGWGILGNPLETKAHANEVRAAEEKRLDDHEQRIRTVESRLDNIDRNQSRTLNLQLRAAKRSIEADLKEMAPTAPGRANLERQLDEINSDLEKERPQGP